MKKALVIRLGAFGDMIFTTPLLKKLKQDGYHITMYVSSYGHDVIKLNPNVNKFIVHDSKLKGQEIWKHWEEIGNQYDRVINLSGSIEQSLLKEEGTEAFYWPKDKRHAECNINYQDKTMEVGGYPDERGLSGELHFSQFELSEARRFRNKYNKYFVVLWALSGSSFHKAYPYTEFVQKALLRKYPDIMFWNIGDTFCEILDIPHEERIKNYAGKWPIRKALAMTRFADVVVGAETGILNAASCFNTHKIIMLSHSSEENLTKYWTNTTVLIPDAICHPCHRLIYTLEACPLDKTFNAPICTMIEPVKMFYAIEHIYQERKNK